MNANISDKTESSKRGILARLRSHFLTGLVFLAPIALTINFIWWAINYIDGRVIPFIPERFRPEVLFGTSLPGAGVLVFLFVTILAGWMTKGLLGRQLMKIVSTVMNKFPIIRPIYNGIKQIAETVFTQSDKNFQTVCYVEYPRKGVYGIGFASKISSGEIVTKTGHELVAVFLPTTPNPTSGFLIYVPAEEVVYLDMSAEEAAKLIISAGLVEPEYLPKLVQ